VRARTHAYIDIYMTILYMYITTV